MLTPSISDLMKNVPSRYLLVNVAARRAREIAQDAEEQGIHLDEKPVKIAINEIAAGQLKSKMKGQFRLNQED